MFLEVKNLSFAYQDKPVFKGLSFQQEQGQVLAIAGVSGCGKSTLLKIIAGILSPESNSPLAGEVYVDGLRPTAYVNSGQLAFMFQEAALMPNRTVRENVALPLEIAGKVDWVKVDKLIANVGLSNDANFLPRALSGGMKTRVSLARSFINNPALLLLDEPFAALDIGWKQQLYLELQLLRQAQGTTVIFVTHDVQEAVLLADRILVLNSQGEISADHTLETSWKSIDKLQDMSGFLKEVYTDYLLPIQDAILEKKKTNEESTAGHH